MNTDLPERVPVMKQKMLLRDGLYEPRTGRGCLIHWAAKCRIGSWLLRNRLREQTGETALSAFLEKKGTRAGAAFWNRTMEGLGYSRIGDEYVRSR